MAQQTIKFKVGLYLTVALSLAVVLFAALIAWEQRNELLDTVSNHVTQLSGVITRSVRFAMLQDQPTYVDTILEDVAQQEGIDRIRIVSKEGKITHSTNGGEIGRIVDRKAEGCSLCHATEKPLEDVPQDKRTWTFTSANGKPFLASMEVIRNQPSCFNAACHQHAQSTPVLGVLEIVYSMEGMYKRDRRDAFTIAGLAFGFVFIASLSVGLFIHRLVYVPLHDLESGAKRVSSGNLEDSIPVRSTDEFGKLAGSFNSMTEALRNSQSELRDWAHTLEQKVEERTEELRVAQAEAARGEKLASVGLLASGVAHELNNPLTGVLTFSHLLREKMPDGSQDAADLDLVIRETKRCASIIRRLLDFARDKPPEKRFADLNQVIEDTVRLVERPAHLRDIEISLDLDRGLPQIWIDPDQVKQVVMNLVVNAEHAIDGQGRITIRTRRLSQPKKLQPAAGAVPTAMVAVTDTGCGIPEENFPRIFDPPLAFRLGVGTGLGLSVSHAIIEAHGGTIEVESEVGKGSTFRLYLPLTPAPEMAEATSSGSNS